MTSKFKLCYYCKFNISEFHAEIELFTYLKNARSPRNKSGNK